MDFKYDFGIPLPLLKELKQRDGLPSWWEAVRSQLDSDWLNNFHKNFTKEGWPLEVQNTEVGVIDTTLNPFAHLGQKQDSIVFPASLVPIFWEVTNVVFGHMQRPNSADPNAKMFISKEGEKESLNDLAALLGRLNYIACPTMTVKQPFIPIVIATSHYVYCHELAHVALSRKFKEAGWTSRQEEFECDRLAFAMMTLTYKSFSSLQQVFSLCGPAVAFGLELIRSCLSIHSNEISTTHPKPNERYHTLRNWCLTAEQHGMIAKGATEFADFFWSYLNRLIQILQSEDRLFKVNPLRDTLNGLFIDKPITSDEITLMITQIIQWCSFGDQTLAKQNIRQILNERTHIENNTIIHNIKEFRKELIDQTGHLEQIIGFLNLLKN